MDGLDRNRTQWSRLLAPTAIVLVAAAIGCSREPVDSSTDTVADGGSAADTAAPDTGSTVPDSGDAPDGDPSTTDTREDSETGGPDGGTDGTDTPSDITFRVSSPRSDPPLRYRLRVVERPTMIEDGSRFEADPSNDEIVEEDEGWLIEGRTGTSASADRVHGDSYRWPRVESPRFGIECWSAQLPADAYTLAIDGESVDPSDLSACPDEPVPDHEALGGGEAYVAQRELEGEPTYCGPSSGDVVVQNATVESLQSALEEASSGDVVYLPGEMEIELGSTQIRFPSGVTLASNRGCDGADGGRLYSDTQIWPQFYADSNARLFGLRLSGPEWDWRPLDSPKGMGVRVEGDEVEIANCDLNGYAGAAITSVGDDVHVHHNHIHHNPMGGLGYGVNVNDGHTLIEYNRLDYNRHSVAGGAGNGGYELRYNVLGTNHISQVIDQHKPGGTTTLIHHNTVKTVESEYEHDATPLDEPQRVTSVAIRGVPSDRAVIHHNWFFNDTPPKDEADDWGPEAIVQVGSSGWNNVYHEKNKLSDSWEADNHYGTDEPDCSIGAPRDGC